MLVGAALVAAHVAALGHVRSRTTASGLAVPGGLLVLAVAKHLGVFAVWRRHRRRPPA